MRMVSHSGREAITGKLIRARRLRMQTTLQLLVASGVIRLANVEPRYLVGRTTPAGSFSDAVPLVSPYS
jgi:hypothetical protein